MQKSQVQFGEKLLTETRIEFVGGWEKKRVPNKNDL